MGSGLFLLVVGAILAFAVDDGVPHINLHVTGFIIMLAGGAVIAYARNRVDRERVITRRDGADAGEATQHVVEEVVRERDSAWPHGRESSY